MQEETAYSQDLGVLTYQRGGLFSRGVVHKIDPLDVADLPGKQFSFPPPLRKDSQAFILHLPTLSC